MKNDDNLLDYVNKVKPLADQLVCLEVPVWEIDIVMTLVKNLPASYKYLITTSEIVPMKDLTMEYVTTRLLYEMSKRKEKECQGEDVIMVLRQSNMGDLPL